MSGSIVDAVTAYAQQVWPTVHVTPLQEGHGCCLRVTLQGNLHVDVTLMGDGYVRVSTPDIFLSAGQPAQLLQQIGGCMIQVGNMVDALRTIDYGRSTPGIAGGNVQSAAPAAQ